MTDEFGQQRTTDDLSQHNALRFLVRQMIGEARHAIPVVVKAVHDGGTGKPPTVDVQVLVKLMDGAGNTSDHVTMFGLPAMRLQGGGNAIICDPVAGDVGLAIVSDRDISAVKKNAGAVSQPGSFRRHNLADSIYIGVIIKAADIAQSVQFTANGITIADKNGNTIVMSSSGINLNGVVIDSHGNITTPGGVMAGAGGADSVTLQGHEHTANNVPPTPGT